MKGRGVRVMDIVTAAPKSSECYCENRECNCTSEIVARIEAIIPVPAAVESDWPVMPYIAPLIYGDALALVDQVLDGNLPKILLRDRLAHLLMTVDCESRKQERVVFGEEPIDVEEVAR